ncbi:MAG: hypothetical protein ACQEQ4_07160 [Fibrobacterota bacterium]
MNKIRLLILSLFLSVGAGTPDDLPGQELSPDLYFRHIAQDTQNRGKDTAAEEEGKTPGTSLSLQWLDSVSQTWEAPPVAEQMSELSEAVKVGMGAIFIPRMSNSAESEPEVFIEDEEGSVAATGRTGQMYNLLPGRYTIKIGTIQKRPVIENISVDEGRLQPVLPNWGGVKIEVTNKSGQPIRGSYDLAKMAPITPLGRGQGRDINLAEDLSTWLLPPGTYKIVSPGSSFNTITNFLTFRVKEGEFLPYTVVQDENSAEIAGGGILTPAEGMEEYGAWNHSINFGGSADMGYVTNHIKDSSSSSLGMSLLLYDRLNYLGERIRLNNLLKLDVTLSLRQDKDDDIIISNAFDELRFNSIFTYKIYERFGPYMRGEYSSGIIPKTEYAKQSEGDEAEPHYFLLFDGRPDSLFGDIPYEVDSLSERYRVKPVFSPINLEAGIGGNVQVFRNPAVNTRFLGGFGMTYERRWDELGTLSEDDYHIADSTHDYFQDYMDDNLHTILYDIDTERFNIGPELMIQNELNIGAAVSANTEIRILAPVERVSKPDITFNNLLSFHLLSNLIADYDFTYRLVQSDDEDLKTNFSRHRFLLRFSFSR